jgi:hypothetical protein
MDELTTLAAAAGVAAVACLLGLALLLSIVMAVSYWKIGTKAGYPGWALLVPFYGVFVHLRMIKRPPSWGWIVIGGTTLQTILSLYELMTGTVQADQPFWLIAVSSILGICTFIYSIRMMHGFSRVFGKSGWYTVGIVLFPYVFIPMLAFGNARYQPDGMVYNSFGPA